MTASLAPRLTGAALVIASGPPQSYASRISGAPLVIACLGSPSNRPRITAAPVVLACLSSPPQVLRSLAWTFTLDGHTFYVLNLGNEGTFVYDTVTQMWTNFSTQGYGPLWNFVYGNMWGDSRIVGADSVSGTLYELAPSLTLDNGFRDIEHIVTGILTSRNRVGIRVDNLRIAGSIGFLDEGLGAVMSMSFSDDNGRTWKGPFDVTLTEGGHYEIAYRSLGTFRAPGRIFQFTDVGGLIRIDGADVYLNSFDEAEQAPGPRPAAGPQRDNGPQQQ